ncbi:MAG: hypothetical protein NC935_08015 [Candidatus Omnitrophica bacterium]|nr:hypothetical protein [Candidatus Omnitrophota bacterium]
MVKRRFFYFILNLTLIYFIFQLISKLTKYLLKDINVLKKTCYKKKTTNFKYFDTKDVVDAEFKELK